MLKAVELAITRFSRRCGPRTIVSTTRLSTETYINGIVQVPTVSPSNEEITLH